MERVWPLILAIGMAACSQSPGPAATAKPAPAQPAAESGAPSTGKSTEKTPGQPAAPPPPSDGQEHLSPVIAEVNGRPLYRAFYEQSLNFMRNRLPAGQDAATLERYLNARFEALDRLVDDELLYQEAQKNGITVDDAAVMAEYNKAAAAAGGEPRFAAAMRSQGISRYDALEGMRKRLTVNKFIRERIAAGLTATDEEAMAVYNENIARFTPEAWVKLYEITVLCPADASGDRIEKARRQAEKILANLRAGQPFESMAREFSEDKDGPNGGYIGFVKRGATYPEFDAVMFSMKPGEVSDVVRTKDGFHILKVAQRRGGDPEPFEKVKEECRRTVLARKQAGAVETFVAPLRNAATIDSWLN